MPNEIDLSDHERECLLFLARLYDSGHTRAQIKSFPRHDQLGKEAIHNVIVRFRKYGFIDWDSNVAVTIYGTVVDAAHQIEKPPPPDYWHDIQIWFQAWPWSIPVVVVAVGLPLIVEWIRIIRTVLEWLGVI
jgi:hypothetical protein